MPILRTRVQAVDLWVRASAQIATVKFLIDDERDFLPDKSVPDIIARTFLAGEIILGIVTEKDEVWLDHDLGEEDPDKTGYRLITNYESYVAYRVEHGSHLFVPTFHPISSNAPGRSRIMQAIQSIYRLSGRVAPRTAKVRKLDDKTRLAQERSPAPWRAQRRR